MQEIQKEKRERAKERERSTIHTGWRWGDDKKKKRQMANTACERNQKSDL